MRGLRLWRVLAWMHVQAEEFQHIVQPVRLGGAGGHQVQLLLFRVCDRVIALQNFRLKGGYLRFSFRNVLRCLFRLALGIRR